MMSADHQGVAKIMVGVCISDMVLAVGISGGTGSPDGPQGECECGGMVE